MARNLEQKNRLLIYVPAPMYRRGDDLMIEAQAIQGLRCWAENFDHVTVMMPLSADEAPVGWEPAAQLGPAGERIQIVALPMAYRPDQFARHLPRVIPQIAKAIDQADYLCFAIGGLFGDWGAVSALVANRGRRPFAVWADRVESEVTWRLRGEGRLRRRLMKRLSYLPMKWLERIVIGKADLGLFHGKETFDAYAPHCGGTSMVVHNIHISREDHIADAALANKMAEVVLGGLRICYVGRMDAMKGPMDWVEALGRLSRSGARFEATWLGDGPERPAVQQRVAALGLEQVVHLPGFTSDRTVVLDHLRQAHVMLFCHKTPESPRCLIEALISGTPLLGYDGAFAGDLTATHGGGQLVPLHDVDALAEALIGLNRDRGRLAHLMDCAKKDGAPFDQRSVFLHRSDLIKRYL